MSDTARLAAARPRAPADHRDKFAVEKLDFFYGDFNALTDITVGIASTPSPRSSGLPGAGSRRSCAASTG